MDFDALESLPELKAGKIGAICCSRPTNPTGNVLTDGEMARLDTLAQEHGIPLIIDNAYGIPLVKRSSENSFRRPFIIYLFFFEIKLIFF